MNRKGFTLIEVVVALALASVLALAVIEIVAPLYQTYRRVSDKADAQLIAGNVLDVLRRSAATVDQVTAVSTAESDGVKIGRVVYAAVDGLLCQDGEPTFAPGYYADKTLTMTAVQERENMTAVTVYLYDRDGALMAEASTVLSPLENAATIYEKDTAAGLYLAALEAISGYQGSGGAGAIFDLIRRGSYGSGFPIFDIATLIEKARLEALAAEAATAAGGDLDAPLPTYYRDLASKELTLTTYIVQSPDNAFESIVYLTDRPDLLKDKTYAPAYLVYYRGLWYARAGNNVASMDTLLTFSGHTGDEIQAILTTTGDWARLDSLLA